ncbi:filamentous hemagglutinin family outer membrane protein [Brevundimonas subvibrioides ATCC 15264]|uniref:Filamentous hemagglutinin family outer membrane protein n=2 Tax=Brevundimonas subvibrioides TaxID=74313 RepID=D9QH20_BRESC|nr:filamentous hemagglutinin family outer membrane protein [Brevundimonas subvibrioides ATCC 15264]
MADFARAAAPHTPKDSAMTRLHSLISGLHGWGRPAGRRTALSASTVLTRLISPAALGLAAALSMGTGATAQTLPTGGVVSAGTATLSTSGNTMTVNQSSQTVAINWQSFSIGTESNVAFVQPDTTSVALNRVLGADPSLIMGGLTSNGQVFLINPNGILFGRSAQVNVGGLVASTLALSDADLMAGTLRFSGTGGSVVNEGAITSGGGYVALLGGQVANDGVIQARLGTIALAAGEAITLDFAGDGLLKVAVDTGAVGTLVRNGGLLQADGGSVIMTTQAAGTLLNTVVNNTGTIQARTIGNRDGVILLLGDMSSGTVTAGGSLDASAPDGGDGGFIETSAATVRIADGARITTQSSGGTTGTWLIDPQDFTVGAGGNISGETLSRQLVTTNVTISTLTGAGAALPGNGAIHINDAIAWSASGTPTTLTLNANRDININAPITATNGNLVACCGRDVNVNAPIVTTRGSVLLNAGQDIRVFHAITTTDGNIALCAGHDVHIDAAVTLTRGSTIPAQSLGLPVGLTLIAGYNASGPGVDGGTIIYGALTPPTTVTVAPTTISYNPVSYAAPTDFGIHFVRTEGATLTQRMLLFPEGGRVADGTTATTLTGFRTTALSGTPAGVSLVAGPGATAAFDSVDAGTDVGITYSGYSLSGADAARYALAGPCCSAGFRTRSTITPAAVITPPVVVPPVVVPPVVVPPVVVPPVVTPPVVTPPVVVTPVVTPPFVTPVFPVIPTSSTPVSGNDRPVPPGEGLNLVIVDFPPPASPFPPVDVPVPTPPVPEVPATPVPPTGRDIPPPAAETPPDTTTPYLEQPRPMAPAPIRPPKQDRN